ncbi:hypothetical protein QE370_002498 [Aeromicrobium sp. SORGH_AS981]|nr:hypothetical protein [Aeromicrobium sp. SORGH_AS_0981]
MCQDQCHIDGVMVSRRTFVMVIGCLAVPLTWRSRRAAALPQGVSSCWCAAAGASSCRCAASAGAGGGLRKGLDRTAGNSAGSGSRAAGRARVDARCCVRVLNTKDAASATGSRHQRRSVQPQAHEGRRLDALWGGAGSASPFSWHGPREGSIITTSSPVGGGSATCRALRRLQIHRWPAQAQTLASNASHSPRTRAAAAPSRPGRGPFGTQVESRPRQRSPTWSPTHTDAAAGQAESRADDVRRPDPAAARPGGGRSPCAGRR